MLAGHVPAPVDFFPTFLFQISLWALAGQADLSMNGARQVQLAC